MKYNLLTHNQIEMITSIISCRCNRFRKFQEKSEDLFADIYSPMRKGHSITHAVISGFVPETKIEGITITPIEYGLGQKQPELVGSKTVLHIYRDNNPLGTEIVKSRCRKYNSDLTQYPVFAYIKYKERKDGTLQSLLLIVPDANGKIVETQDLLTERAE